MADEQVAAWLAQTDQAAAGAGDFGAVTASYYLGLAENGVPPEQAASITESFVSSVIVLNEMFGESGGGE
jgi:hypothetical protein